MNELDLSAIEALTFDCYGTLIDWRGGERAAVAPLASLAGADVGRLIDDRHRIDLELIAGPYAPYSELLGRSLALAAERQGLALAPDDRERFAASMAHWPPFAESHECLLRLSSKFRLAILSNVETATLEASVRALDAPFAELVTAEQLASYKPARAHFDEGLARLGLPASSVLHVAQSFHHDHRPALSLGWNTAWINRLDEPLPEPSGPRPRLVVPDLRTLCERLHV